MKPFILSLPRTRSSIVYHLMAPYAEQHYGMFSNIHPEYFLEFSVENFFTVNSQVHFSEIYPIIKHNKIETFYMYPYYFDNSTDRLTYKLSLLQQQKNEGIEYFFKGSIDIFKDYRPILNFFSDRKIVLIKRKNFHNLVISFLVAVELKTFHKTSGTAEIYKKLLNEKIIISDTVLVGLENFIGTLLKIDEVEKFLIENNFNTDILYYEELDSKKEIEDTISRIYNTDNWKKYIVKNDLPIDTNINYQKVVKNYSFLIDKIDEAISKVR